MATYPQMNAQYFRGLDEAARADAHQVELLDMVLSGARESDVRSVLAVYRNRERSRLGKRKERTATGERKREQLREQARRRMQRYLDEAHADLYGWRERD